MFTYSIVGQAITDQNPSSSFINTVVSADNEAEAYAAARIQFPTATDLAIVGISTK